MIHTVSPYVYPGLFAKPEPPTPENITKCVCQYNGLMKKDLMQKTRQRRIVRSRWMCWALIKKFHGSEYTMKRMGKMFGNYDHTTVLHGLQTLTDDLVHEDLLRSDFEAIERMIRNN